MSLNGRPVALVTGGSRGIGAATVRRLAHDGYNVSLCYQSSAASAEETAEQARHHGVQTLVTQADVTDPAAARDLVQSTETQLGPIDTVVTAAGIVRDKSLALMTDDDWAAVLRTNLDGTFHVCRAAIFPMLKRRRGSIITISSVAGVYGNAGQTNYSASKAGIIGFTKALAREVGPFGIRANVVTPGFIVTDMTAAVLDRQQSELRSRVALGRWGEADEVAELVSFLASARSAYITAAVVAVDGGIRL